MAVITRRVSLPATRGSREQILHPPGVRSNLTFRVARRAITTVSG